MIVIKKAVYNEWRKWFAWRPVTTKNDEIVWLEFLERKIEVARIPNVSPSEWVIYRRIEKEKDDEMGTSEIQRS